MEADTYEPKRFLTAEVSIACSEATQRSKWNNRTSKEKVYKRNVEKKKISIETLVSIVADKQCACETLCSNMMSKKKIDYQIK